MNRITPALLFLHFFIFVTAHPGVTATGTDIARLKKAGLGDKTVQLIVQEKVIETALFSTEDFVNMKKAGVSDKTMQALIENGSFLTNSKPIVYGRQTQSVRQITVHDIIDLKNNGVSDSIIQSVIEATTACDEKDRERAWRMLEHLRLRIVNSPER
ncbi:MAG: hypothetical protein PVH42_05065 [Desulfobacterales bacterium]|jgi:hypothetical protein